MINLTAEDKLEIMQLISDYNHHLGANNAEAFADLYTADGSYISDGKAPVTGRANLVTFIKKRSGRPGVENRTQLVSNITIRPTPEGAHAKSHYILVDAVDGGFKIGSMQIKVDELRRENGKWKFYVRRSRSLGGAE